MLMQKRPESTCRDITQHISRTKNLRATTDNEGNNLNIWARQLCKKASSRKSMGCASATAGDKAAEGRGLPGKMAVAVWTEQVDLQEKRTQQQEEGAEKRASATTLAEPGVWLRH